MLLLPALLPLAAATVAFAVKTDDFKRCDQASFCRRLRSLAPRQAAAAEGSWASPYRITGHGALVATGEEPDEPPSIVFPVRSALLAEGEAAFELKLDVLADGIVRVRLDEVGGLRQRYDEAARWALVDGALGRRASFDLNTDDHSTNVTFTSSFDGAQRLELTHEPLRLALFRADRSEPELVLNGRGLLHIEHFRPHPTAGASPAEPLAAAGEQGQTVLEPLAAASPPVDRSWFEGPKDEWERDLWEEKWKTWTDSKPKGPEALSFDIDFPAAQTHLYGLPEHAAPLSLPATRGPGAHFSDPYRLFNVDIFEYLADSAMSMYGAIPLVHAHSTQGSVGVLALSASETWVDVERPAAGGGRAATHWMAESGILDLFLLTGGRGEAGPRALGKQYASLTGPSALPAHWALGYHQCRWNYLDQADVLDVDRRFDEVTADEAASDKGGQGWPLDVTWLDIEYAEEHRYFDWDVRKFPDVKGMLAKIAAKGRKMVAIVDPHIKRSPAFGVYSSAVAQDLVVKQAGSAVNGSRTDFEGWCWPGSSVWVDFFLERSWGWWAELFRFETWTDSARNLFIWNDMNEPSVFNGPEISMPRDALHQDGKWEHRDVHNINGMMFARSTAEALIAREDPPQRPFVLSRSFFAGSQRYGAIWTGDNLGTWEHLAGSIPMLLSLNIAGMSFSGADVGGFFGNPTPEFLVRFYQAGAFMPFFRAHAHIDTKRREPYLLEEPFKGYVRDMLRLRYSLLPVWYTAFREAAVDGTPVIRPQYVVHPTDAGGFGLEDQFYVGGSGLLVKPVVEEEAEETEIYLSDDQPYYDYFSHHLHPSSAKPRTIPYAAPLSAVPVLHQGGSILPIRTRIRRASPLMWQDPYTLVVALSKEGTARGELYSDDGDSFAFQQGEFVWRGFEFSSITAGRAVLRSVDLASHRPKDIEGLISTATAANDAVATYSPANGWAERIAHVRVERVVVLGLKASPRRVTVDGEPVEFDWQKGMEAAGRREGRASELTLKNPPVKIASDWEIRFE